MGPCLFSSCKRVTSTMTLPRIHHYVPQFLLRNFANADEQLWAFDKQTDKIFQTHISNIACERDFYSVAIDEYVATLEPGLSQLEGVASLAVSHILATRSLSSLTEEQHAALAVFIAAQIFRTPSMRNHMLQVNRLLEQRLRAEGADPSHIWGFNTMTEEDAKVASMDIIEDLSKFVPLILDKCWILAEAQSEDRFYIGDNAIARQNLVDTPGRGNLGLNSPGIEIHLPISSTAMLNLVCPTTVVSCEANRQRVAAVKAARGQGFHELDALGVELDLLSEVFRGQCNLPVKPEHTMNFNSLQVIYAERFVFSSTNDFSLAQAMIAEHPDLRGGPVVEMA